MRWVNDMNKSDISTEEELKRYKSNYRSSIYFWDKAIYRYLKDRVNFKSTFINDVPVSRYWHIAWGD